MINHHSQCKIPILNVDSVKRTEKFTCDVIDYNELQVYESVTESGGVMVKQTFMEVLLETSRAHRCDVVNLIGKCEE
jgi:hypothetical protein